MVPMMMSADGSGATSAVPMMTPYMGAPPAAAMPQAYCPVPQQQVAAPVTATNPAPPTTSTPAPSSGASTPAAPPAAQAPVAGAGAPNHHQMMAAPQSMGQPQAVAPYPFMMQAPMAGGYMMPVPTAGHHPQMHQHHPMMPGQPMAMVPHQASMAPLPQGPQQDGQGNVQEQKDSSPGMNGGSNLAHCA